ncbi:hypothetical protein CRUP_001151 [Coryphaenoides rupestris]|nr:hypothetical protein CRUP_001151 [Coryphaenoides rupestris]
MEMGMGVVVVMVVVMAVVVKQDIQDINLKISNDVKERPDTVKQKNAFPPNFIHSLDSTHMMLTSLNCYREEGTSKKYQEHRRLMLMLANVPQTDFGSTLIHPHPAPPPPPPPPPPPAGPGPHNHTPTPPHRDPAPGLTD